MDGRESPASPPQALGPWGLPLVGTLLAALVALLGWQFVESRSHIDQMMSERGETLTRMVAIEVRNVARFGMARRERIDQVLDELAASPDVDGVLLERDDGAVVISHGVLPDEPPDLAEGPLLVGATLLCAQAFHIDTQGCGHCRSCEGTCAAAGGGPLDGDYRVLLAFDAAPYLALRRAVWIQGGAGAALVLFLGAALFVLRRQAIRAAAMGQALAVAEERGRSLERLGLLAGGLAHEIKNPVGSLRGFAQLIAERAAPGTKEEEYASLMVSELDVITRRLDRLKDLARADPPRLEPGRPAEVVRRVASLLAPDAEARRVTLELDLPDGEGPETMIDRDRLRDLVVNLVMNAIDASPEGGVVRVSLREDGTKGGLVVEVEDEGPGIPEAERDLALRPFHSTKPDGLGLGLAVALQAAEDHGGTLELGDGERGGLSARALLRPGRSSRVA